MSNVVSAVEERIKKRRRDLGPQTAEPAAPATDAGLDADEARLGFRLPPLLRKLYTTVGNGGFGPGYGFMGMTGGTPDDTGQTAVETYLNFRQPDPEDAAWNWPEGLLPICHWGCAIYSCIDCTDPRHRVQVFDPNRHDHEASWDDAFFDDCESFEHWIASWAGGTDLWKERMTLILAGRGSPPMARSPAPVPPTPRKKSSNVGARLNRAFGPIVAGIIIDSVDLVTFGPIGLVLGLPLGGLAGYWMGRCLRLQRNACLLCALAAGIYCMMPFTEFVPLATLVGAFARFRESGQAQPSEADPATFEPDSDDVA